MSSFGSTSCAIASCYELPKHPILLGYVGCKVKIPLRNAETIKVCTKHAKELRND